MTSVIGRTSDRFAKLSEDDGEWLLTQNECVLKLWIEASLADPFGESFRPLKSSLKETSFKRARLALADEGLFEFEPKCNRRDGRKIEYWMVKNLHGSKTSYWTGPLYEKPSVNQESRFLETTEISCQERHAIDQERHAIDQERHAIDQERHAIPSETLSLIDSCPSLELFRNNKMSTDLEIKNENLSIETRSGRLELEASTKVAASAPSPDASIVEKKSFATSQDLGSSKDPESDEEDPDLFASAHGLRHAEDLGSTEPSRSSSEKKSFVSTECLSVGEGLKIPLAPHAISPQSDTLPHHDASDTALAEPTVESGTPPLGTVSEAHTASNDDPFLAIYHEACCRYNERGLKLQDSDERWAEFYLAGSKGLLYPIKDGFKANGLEHALQMLPPDLLCDYLFYNSEHYSEPAICIKDGSGKLKMVFWSQLPAIVFDRPQKARN